MISRVAESCFWLHRHLERVDRTARNVDVNRAFVLDSQLEDTETWWPLLVVSGQGPSFVERFGEEAAADGEQVQAYLTWDRDNPVSILVATEWARENARTIRETVSREMWGCLNRFWLWLSEGPGKRLYARDRAEFFTHVRESVQLFRGVSADTMLREEPWEFMLLAHHLERANLTARLLDVKHPLLRPEDDRTPETSKDLAQWHAILRSCSASEPFFKRTRPFRGGEVARFLVQDPDFPFAIGHCLTEASECLGRIRTGAPGADSADRLGGLAAQVHGLRLAEASVEDLHESLTAVIQALADLNDALHRDFFDPAIEPRAEGSGGALAAQS